MSIEMKTFIDSALRPNGPSRLNGSEARRFVTRRGIPCACLSVEMCTSIYQRGLPPGGVRPHHGIEEEQDREESQEKQALIDFALSDLVVDRFHLFPFFSFFLPQRRASSRSCRTSLTGFPSARPRTRSITFPMRAFSAASPRASLPSFDSSRTASPIASSSPRPMPFPPSPPIASVARIP